MLAVLSLAGISRCCSALAIAAPSFSAVARGVPSTGAIVTLMLSRRVSIGDPGRGASFANGCGNGWQAAATRTAAIAACRQCVPRIPVIRRGRSPLSLEGGSGKPAAVSPFAPQTGAPVTEKLRLFGDGVLTNDINRCHPGPSKTVGDVTLQIEQEMAFARR